LQASITTKLDAKDKTRLLKAIKLNKEGPSLIPFAIPKILAPF